MTAFPHKLAFSSSLTRNVSVLSLSLLMVANILFAAPSALAQQATSTPEIAGQQGQQEQQTIHITKDGTNSYIISGTMSSIGSFDTTYRVVGERSAIRSAENLIISTITDDFSSSRTIGYITPDGTTTDAGATPEPTLPSPFATPEQITERITSELRRVIGSAENNTPQSQVVEIKCDFGMTLDDMHCFYAPSVGEAEGTTRPPPTNDTGETPDPLTVQAIWDTTNGGTAPATFLLEADVDGGTAPYTFHWDFGDGQEADVGSTYHTYEDPGTYNATVTVTDSTGQNASDTTRIRVAPANGTLPLTVQAIWDSTDGDQAPATFLLEANAKGGTLPYSFHWDFGDGQEADVGSTYHTYEDPGTYTATITVTDATGQTASDIVQPRVSPSPATNATTGETTTPPTMNATAGGETTTTPETTTPPPTTGEGEETTSPPPDTTTPNTQGVPLSDPGADRPTTGEGEATTTPTEPLDTLGQ